VHRYIVLLAEMDENGCRTGFVLSMSTFIARGMECMVWPAYSCDVNQIEHVWNILQRRVSARPPQPKIWEDLAQALI